MSKEPRALDKGYTIVEVLIVIGLIATIALFSIPTFLDMINSYRASTAASEVAINLRYARNAAIKYKTVHTVSLTATAPGSRDFYTVTGKTLPYYLSDRVKFDASTTITFNPNGSSSGATITLKDPRGNDAFRIDVRTTGAVALTDLEI